MTPEVLDDADWLATLFTSRGAGDVSREDAASRILAMQDLVAEHGIGARVLRTELGGVALGYCAIIVGRGSLEEPELAYELLPEARGHGYATEGSRALLAATFGTGRSRIWATVRDWNSPSLRVLARLGFRHDHATHDARGELVWLVAEAQE
ncbi:MAG: GNAT family N-acetyltransferase [Cellulomonadaceae bacterium]|nr:GNAT family N-acetyltransferase [Cellulomonadaceae bacterium]